MTGTSEQEGVNASSPDYEQARKRVEEKHKWPGWVLGAWGVFRLLDDGPNEPSGAVEGNAT